MTTAERLRGVSKRIYGMAPAPSDFRDCLEAADELDSLQARFQVTAGHMQLCRALLKVPNDETLCVVIEQLQKQLAEAKALLKKFEWSEVIIPSGYAYCPVCHFSKIGEAHQEGCALAAMVKEDGK